MKKIDLTNQQFGHLTVLYEMPKEIRKSSTKVSWMCKCDCGNEIEVTTDKLRSNQQVTCGHICPFYKENFIKNLVGQRFGKLVVIKDSGNRQSRQVIWKCKCDCGNECEYLSRTLQVGKAVSCGCLKESYGEYRISQILEDNNIPFQREYSFNTCRFPDTDKMARFDFYVNNSYLIEFDGSQHFFTDNYKWNTKEKLGKTKEHDAFKNDWCKKNKVPLIRIPYTHMREIELADLLLESTKFLEV